MEIPLVVLWLVLGAVFFTIFMKFINVKGFFHAIQLVRGKYDDPDDKGEVSHFQALVTALSGLTLDSYPTFGKPEILYL